MFIVIKIENDIHYLIKKEIKATQKQLDRQKNWYDENRIEILERKMEKGWCSCGKLLRLADLHSHLRRPIHFKLLKLKNNIILK